MDAQLRSVLDPNQTSPYSFFVDPLPLTEVDDDFPTDLSAIPESRLFQLCDTLFLELDSEMPDLRAMERYQTVCDELAHRQISSGVA
jgi:hypothetical protein